MSKKFIIGIILVTALIFGGMIALIKAMNGGVSNQFTDSSSGTLTITENNINLGEIPMSEGKVDIPYTIVNESNKAVLLGAASTSCMCTEGVLTGPSGERSPTIDMHTPVNLNMRLEPGESAELTATFDPNAHGPDATGFIVRHVYIETNSSNRPQLDFVFKGNVVK